MSVTESQRTLLVSPCGGAQPQSPGARHCPAPLRPETPSPGTELRPSESWVSCVPIASGWEQRNDLFIHLLYFSFSDGSSPKAYCTGIYFPPPGTEARHPSPGPSSHHLPLRSPRKPGPSGPPWKRELENVTSCPCFTPSGRTLLDRR